MNYIYQPNTLSKRFSRSRNVTKQSATNESDRVSICSCNQVCSLPFSLIFYRSSIQEYLFFHPFLIPSFPSLSLLLWYIGANRLTGDFGLTRSISHDFPFFETKEIRLEACRFSSRKESRFNYRF